MAQVALSVPANEESKQGSSASYPRKDGLVEEDEKGSSSKRELETNQTSSISPRNRSGEAASSAARNQHSAKKQPIINFSSAVMVSSDNMSFQ